MPILTGPDNPPEPERRDAIVDVEPIHTTARTMPQDDEDGPEPAQDPMTIPDPDVAPVRDTAEPLDAGADH
jgi:hypothetical protein